MSHLLPHVQQSDCLRAEERGLTGIPSLCEGESRWEQRRRRGTDEGEILQLPELRLMMCEQVKDERSADALVSVQQCNTHPPTEILLIFFILNILNQVFAALNGVSHGNTLQDI